MPISPDEEEEEEEKIHEIQVILFLDLESWCQFFLHKRNIVAD
jgi:hypothetical protein